MKVRFTRQAQRQLDTIFAYLASHNPIAAEEVVGVIQRFASMLSEHQDLGRPVRLKGARVLTTARYPYRMSYTVVKDEIVIVSVRHTSRRPLRSHS